jgi:hypothetical protein
MLCLYQVYKLYSLVLVLAFGTDNRNHDISILNSQCKNEVKKVEKQFLDLQKRNLVSFSCLDT